MAKSECMCQLAIVTKMLPNKPSQNCEMSSKAFIYGSSICRWTGVWLIQTGLRQAWLQAVDQVHVCHTYFSSSLDYWRSKACFSHDERQECKNRSNIKAFAHKTSANSHWPNEFPWPSPQAMVEKVLSTHYETMTRVQLHNAAIGREELRPIIIFTSWVILFIYFFGHIGEIKD